MSKTSIKRSLILAMLLVGVAWLSPTEAEAGRWPAEPLLTIENASGDVWGFFVCERRFLTTQCTPGETKWERIPPQ